MKIENTLNKLLILLIFITSNVVAKPTEIEACNAAINKNDANSALKIANEVLAKDNQSHGALICKGRALGLQDNYAEALPLFEQAISAASTNFDKVLAYILQGNLHKDFKKTHLAIASYEKSIELAKANKNQQFERISYNLIGDVHAQNNDLETAIKHYLTGAELANNDNERADSYERLAKNYTTLGQYDSAIEYQLKATIMQRKAGTLDAYANASATLGQIQLEAKEYANAEKTFKKLEKFSIDNGGAYYEAKANFHLAQTKAATNDKAAAKTLLAKARTIAQKIGAKDLNAEIDSFDQKINK